VNNRSSARAAASESEYVVAGAGDRPEVKAAVEVVEVVGSHHDAHWPVAESALHIMPS
jgi:hypothetical protein